MRGYKLNKETGEVTEAETLEEMFGGNFEDTRRVALTTLARVGPCKVDVSTVFLALDHNYFGGPPLLFETMIFGGPEDQEFQERWSTFQGAKAGHEAIVRVRRSNPGYMLTCYYMLTCELMRMVYKSTRETIILGWRSRVVPVLVKLKLMKEE